MKRIFTLGLGLFALTATRAQQKEGKVIYERTVQMQVSFAGMNEEMHRMIPRSRTDKFELSFGNNQSLWKQADPDNEEETFSGEGGGMQIRMVAGGANDVIYNNFETGKRVEQRDIMDRKFIIDDSIRPLKWKMTGETKTILNHTCMKATATQISQRMQMTMDNGKMERKEVSDTANIIAWFASDIPVSAGPSEFQGQLPGLILEMDIANGRQTFKALTIEPKADMAAIKEPSGKKRYTQAEFRQEREKMMQEMQRNGGGPGRVIRFN
ncbi:MAG TPA: GLPGLI family protein [Chitinophagaceae bacterium]|nr:GLPGLI family protein [Chitinophagaceae bacterium]